MKLYSMTLGNQPKNHAKRSEWEMDREWNITKVRQLELIIKRLREATRMWFMLSLKSFKKLSRSGFRHGNVSRFGNQILLVR